MPDRARALRADWAPGPGVFVLKRKKEIHQQAKHLPIRSEVQPFLTSPVTPVHIHRAIPE